MTFTNAPRGVELIVPHDEDTKIEYRHRSEKRTA